MRCLLVKCTGAEFWKPSFKYLKVDGIDNDEPCEAVNVSGLEEVADEAVGLLVHEPVDLGRGSFGLALEVHVLSARDVKHTQQILIRGKKLKKKDVNCLFSYGEAFKKKFS